MAVTVTKRFGSGSGNLLSSIDIAHGKFSAAQTVIRGYGNGMDRHLRRGDLETGFEGSGCTFIELLLQLQISVSVMTTKVFCD